MQRAKAEYPISRRAAFLGASAAVATVGLPAAVKAAATGAGADAQLIAMVDEWEHVQEADRAVGIEKCMLEKALLPEPPESIEGHGRPALNHISRIAGWRTRTRKTMDMFCRAIKRSEPDHLDLIEHNYRRTIAELEAYVATCEELYHGPALTALRDRQEALKDRDLELLAAIAATRARSPAGVLRKMQATDGWDHFTRSAAGHSSLVAPKLLTSILHDLESLAGQAS